MKAGIKGTFLMFMIWISAGAMAQPVVKEVNAAAVKKALATEKGWVVLDVRTPSEFAQGHIPGAVNIDLYRNDALEQIGKLDKNGKYIVYCRTRNRSGVVTDYMAKNGFKNIWQMVDGIGGWDRLQK